MKESIRNHKFELSFSANGNPINYSSLPHDEIFQNANKIEYVPQAECVSQAHSTPAVETNVMQSETGESHFFLQTPMSNQPTNKETPPNTTNKPQLDTQTVTSSTSGQQQQLDACQNAIWHQILQNNAPSSSAVYESPEIRAPHSSVEELARLIYGIRQCPSSADQNQSSLSGIAATAGNANTCSSSGYIPTQCQSSKQFQIIEEQHSSDSNTSTESNKSSNDVEIEIEELAENSLDGTFYSRCVQTESNKRKNDEESGAVDDSPLSEKRLRIVSPDDSS